MSHLAYRATLLSLAALFVASPAAFAQRRSLYTAPTPAPQSDQQPSLPSTSSQPPPPPNYAPPPPTAPYVGGVTPYANANYNPTNYGGYGYGGGYGYRGGLGAVGGRAAGTGEALQGLSSYTQAQGNYQI